MGLLTLNILLGLLLSTRYNPQKQWPNRKIKIFKIHNWTGYTALAVHQRSSSRPSSAPSRPTAAMPSVYQIATKGAANSVQWNS